MQDSANPLMGMSGHIHHAMMIADFKRCFYLVLILTTPDGFTANDTKTAGIVLVNSNPKDIVSLITFGKATFAK